MKVELLAYTPNPDEVCGFAARTCTSDELPHDRDNRRALMTALESGHTSVAEHATFTFAISGVSRALTHQLVRHRIGFSYAQQSQRFVKTDREYVAPESLIRSFDAEMEFAQAMTLAWNYYHRLLSMGIPEEDARYVLPNAACTNIVVTANGRALLNFFGERCCLHAQDEIRQLATEMLELVKPVAPALFANAGPKCAQTKVCREKRSCGYVQKFQHKQ